MIHQILLLVAIAAVAAAIFVEVRGWKRGVRLMSKKQKCYRISAASMLEIILLMILVSRVATLDRGPIFEISYWSTTIALAFGLVVIALLDLKESVKIYEQNAKDNVLRLIEGEDKNRR